jgi:hypothetical protein
MTILPVNLDRILKTTRLITESDENIVACCLPLEADEWVRIQERKNFEELR